MYRQPATVFSRARRWRYAALVALAGVLTTGSVCGQPAGGSLPDPTRPPTPEELAAWRGQPLDQAVRWRLESVLISESRKVAVINGRRVSIGDIVDGARVTAIEPTHATITLNDKTSRLAIRRHGIDLREPQ